MPQLNLMNDDSVPWALAVALRSETQHPDRHYLEVRVTNHGGDLIGSWGASLRSIECDFTPTIVQAALEAYLYGNTHTDVTRACRRVRQAAREAYSLHLRDAGL